MAKKGQDNVIVPPLPEVQLDEQETGEDQISFQLAGGEYRAGQELVHDEKTGEYRPEPPRGGSPDYSPVGLAPPYGGDDQYLKQAVESIVSGQIAALRMEMTDRFQALADQVMSIASARSNGISAEMVGGTFNCPECSIRIPGPGLTSHQKGTFYEHPWGETNASGKRCRLQGARFKPPVIFLEFLKPLTGKQQ